MTLDVTGAGQRPAPSRIVVAITGATGPVIGVRIIDLLMQHGVETHVVVSRWGAKTLEHETGITLSQLRDRASVVHSSGDQASVLSSGSFTVDAMIVAPCSMRTLAAIATGVSDNLVARAADVTLKERRRLVLIPREAPLSQIHLQNMLTLAQMGVVIVPPSPAFYTLPSSVDDIVNQIAVRALDQVGLHTAGDGVRWDGVMRRAGSHTPDVERTEKA